MPDLTIEERDVPVLNLSSIDGNAFVIMGTARKVARRAGWTQEKIDEMTNEMKSGDYDNLLQTCFKYFEVIWNMNYTDNIINLWLSKTNPLIYRACETYV